MLKNVYKLSDGHNIVSVICNQKTIEKIVRIMMGYVNLIEEDNINTVIMNICLYEDVYEVNDDLMTEGENIKAYKYKWSQLGAVSVGFRVFFD